MEVVFIRPQGPCVGPSSFPAWNSQKNPNSQSLLTERSSFLSGRISLSRVTHNAADGLFCETAVIFHSSLSFLLFLLCESLQLQFYFSVFLFPHFYTAVFSPYGRKKESKFFFLLFYVLGWVSNKRWINKRKENKFTNIYVSYMLSNFNKGKGVLRLLGGGGKL